jgi:preprotein translocase subunit SecG
VLQWVVGIVHVINLLVLAFFILLHSGKGGGLSDMFGGGASGAASGSTVVERNLDRMTVVSALVFAFTTVGLGLLLSV